jgi:hypothetical protein
VQWRVHSGTIKAELLCFDGCPNWTVAPDRLLETLTGAGLATESLVCERVMTPEDADRRQLRSSSTILLDGKAPFADDAAPVASVCRVYQTEHGPAGALSLRQLTEARRK